MTGFCPRLAFVPVSAARSEAGAFGETMSERHTHIIVGSDKDPDLVLLIRMEVGARRGSTTSANMIDSRG